jgi:hypothetical protein
MKRNITRVLILAVFAFAQTGCNASFGRFFHLSSPQGLSIPSGVLSFSNVTTTSLSVSFAQASDTTDTADQLNYLLIYSTTNNVGAITDITNLPAGVLSSGGWTQYPAAGESVSDLLPGTNYYFNVIVRNSANQFSLYSQGTQSTVSAAPPALTDTALNISGTTATSATLSFTASTDAGATYLVVYSQTGNLGTITDTNTLPSGASSFGSWQSYPSPVSLTGLSANTTYYVNVIAKNSSGGFALYTMKSFPTGLTALPTISNSALTASSVGTTAITFSFSEATNNAGLASALEYLVVYAASDLFPTVASIDDASLLALGITKSGDWQSYPPSATISGLTTGVTCYFSVIVRNANGFALYATASAKPDDLQAPVPSSTTITPTVNSAEAITLAYSEAADNVSDSTTLQYKVVCSSLGSIDQIATADAITGTPGLIQDWNSYAGTIQKKGLSPNTTYYFNVLVKDTHVPANIAIYSCASATTDKIAGDPYAPTISNTGLTLTQGSDIYTVSLAWTKAVDELKSGSSYTLPANLQYKVVASSAEITEANFASATALTDAAGDGWEKDIGSLEGITVADGITTYFMAAVKDEAGNIAYYAAASYTPSAVRSELLCYFAANGNLTDTTGKISSGSVTVTGTAAYSADAAEGSGAFDFSANKTGTNYIEVTPSSAIQNLAANFTISLWIKVNAFTNSYEEILSRGGLRGYKVQRYGTSSRIMFLITHDWNSAAQSRVVSTAEVADGKWHHIACTYATGGGVGDERIFMYIDGVSQGTFSGGTDDNWFNTTGSVCFTSTSDKLQLGENTAHTAEKYTGLLDEVRIYSKVLSAAEIRALGR